jgi:hypothetical protein
MTPLFQLWYFPLSFNPVQDDKSSTCPLSSRFLFSYLFTDKMSPRATTSPSTHSPNDIRTTLNYYLDPGLGGHSSFEAGTVGYYRRKFDERPVQIRDIRGQAGAFNISKQGFELVKYTSAERAYADDEQVKRIVYPEVEELLKKM